MDELSEAGGWFNHGVGPARGSAAGDPPEADLAAMLDAMTVGVVLARRPDAGRPHPMIVWTNHAMRTLTGLAERELVGARLRRLRGAEPADPAFAALVNAVALGEAWSGDLLVASGKGAGSRLFARTAPLPDGRQSIVTLKSGNPHRDVAEPVDLPAISRMLGDLLHGGLYRLGADIDAGLRLEWADQAVERVTGYPLAELQARGGLSGIVVPRDRAKVRKRNLELMSGVSSEISYRIETSQGLEVRLIDRARPLRSHPGVPAGGGMAIERAVGTLRLVLPERDDLPTPGLPFADFKLLADLLGATLLAVDADLRVLWVTACEGDGFGDALQGQAAVQLDDILGGELLEEWRDHIEQVLLTGRRVEAAFQWPAAGQDWQLILEPMSSDTALAVVRLAGSGETAAQDPSGILRRTGLADQRLLGMILDHVSDGILMLDGGGVVRRASRSAERIFDLPAARLVGARAEDLLVPSLVAEGRLVSLEHRSSSSGRREERVAARASGELVPVEIAVTALSEELDDGSVVLVHDLTLRRQNEETIRSLAYTDPLTGLPNRLLFLDRLSQAIERARRARQQLAVMVVDLDRFKLINESLGLDKGDRVLRAVATRIGNALRKSDTVARPGGDEFLILALATEGAEGAGKVAQKTLDSLQAPFQINGDEPTVAASIGISLFPFDGDDPDQLLKNADTALARAKELGASSYQFYTTDMNARAYQRLVLESRLRKAVDRGELLLHFQPLIGLVDDRIVGAEALLRWNSPEMGMIPPSDFIPIAEETGLILPIGDWVLRQSVMQMRDWHADGLEGLRIAVNISARQFQARDFVSKIRRLLADTAFAGQCLELELTESSIMRDVQDTVHRLHELMELGVRVTVDDFGTGYSSLAYLKRFPIGGLKIDRSFIADVTTDANDAAIARAVVALADTLRVRVVGEGVETREQLEFLRQIGCDEAQGYLIGRPVPAADAYVRLKEGTWSSHAPENCRQPAPDEPGPA